MTKPLVSVVIPVTSNRVNLLRRALTSVVTQTYPNVEVIVVQDGPGQGVRELIEGLFTHIPVCLVQLPDRRGPSAARNFGVSIARGEFLAFLDSDDEWFPTKLEKQISCFTDPKVCAVGCGSLVKDEQSGLTKVKLTPPLQGDVFSQLLLSNAGIQTSMLAVRRKSYEDVGGFNEQLSFGEEKDLALRLARKSRFAWVPEPLGIQYFNHGDLQLSQSLENTISGIRAFASLWERDAASMFGTHGVRCLNQWLYSYVLNLYQRQIKNGRTIRERWTVLRSLRREDTTHCGWLEISKMAILVILGGRAAKLWRFLTWKKK